MNKKNWNKRNREFTAIGDILSDYLQDSKKIQTGLNKVQVKEAWHKVMGPAISKYTTEIFLDRKTLYVKLSSAALRQELSYGRERIKELLNEELKSDIVENVVLS